MYDVGALLYPVPPPPQVINKIILLLRKASRVIK
jgi:hypothetical protein